MLLPVALADDMHPDTHNYNDGKTKARAFCNSPAFKKLTCGAASDAEEEASTDVCIYCGTMWSLMPKSNKLPTEISSYGSYWQNLAQTISLACHGRVVVRAVFKITQQDKNCTVLAGFLDGGQEPGETPRVRCELTLPSGSGDEAARAVKAKETKCYRCDKGKCPSKVGVWYSDSYTKVVPGCDQKFDANYNPPKVGMIFNPGGKALIAKFEVCSNPGCFDPVYEDNKLKNAIVAEKRDC